MDLGPIQPGTQSSLKGMRPTLRSSEESKFLWLIIQEIKNLTALIANTSTLGPSVATFTVNIDGSNGCPKVANIDWVITTLNVIGKTPTFLLNGNVLLPGIDYNFDNGTGTFITINPFVLNDIYSVIF